MDNKIKYTAAIAGVIAYMRIHEDAAGMQAAAAFEPKPMYGAVPSAPIGLWGISGRHAHMLMRSHMQLKSYHLCK